MEKKPTGIKISFYLFGSLLATAGLVLTFQRPKLSASETDSWLIEVCNNFQKSINGKFGISCCIFLFLLFLCWFVDNKKVNGKKAIAFCSLPISLIWLVAKSMAIDNSLSSIISSTGQIIKSLFCLSGNAFFVYQTGCFLSVLLDKEEERFGRIKYPAVLEKHPFAVPLGLLAILWIPGLLIAFPGYMCIDSYNQLAQFYSLQPFTSHHPYIHTIVMGWIVQFGIHLFGEAKAGIFLFALLQSITLALVLAYVCSSFHRWKAPPAFYIGFLAFFSVAPIFIGYTTVVLKDNLYSSCFLLFMVELIYFVFQGGTFQQKKHLIIWIVSAIGVIVFRNNGKYVLYPLFLIILFCGIRHYLRKENTRRQLIVLFAALLLPVLLSETLGIFARNQYNVSSGSIREMFSLPFQQTARYAKKYGDEVTDEEKQIIDKLLKYDTLADRYDPRISDPVKNKYNNEAELKDIIEYIRVWIKQFFTHPIVYLEATANQNYYLLYPGTENNKIYYTTEIAKSGALKRLKENIDGFGAMTGFNKKMQEIMGKFEMFLFSVPGIGTLCNIGAVNLFLIVLFIWSRRKKTAGLGIVFFPIILSNLIIIAGPVIYGHPRYAFPILYSFPVLLCFALAKRNNNSAYEEK